MAENNTTSELGPADGKRRRISKAQQTTLLEVLGASVILGACIVLSIFMVKYINFNTKIITAKNEAINDYDQTIRNVGVCIDSDRNGRLSTEELERCKPNEISLSSITNSLRYKVLVDTAQSHELETVARQRNANCYDDAGERIDYQRLYELSSDSNERQQYLQSYKICSALRVIPDALPSTQNTEALMASLNQIFIYTGWEPERLAPRDDVVTSTIENLLVIPVSLSVESSDAVVLGVLHGIESSIREFDIRSAIIEWTNSGLSLQATANAYYLANIPAIETKTTLYASPKARSKK